VLDLAVSASAVGIWGITQPVAWGFAIINFVWWIGHRPRRHADLGDSACCSSRVGAIPLTDCAEAMTNPSPWSAPECFAG